MSDQSLSDEEIRQECQRIHREILANRVTLPDGTTGWVGYDVKDSAPVLTGERGLYSGQLGIAVYLAGMYQVFTENQYRREARRAAQFLLDEQPSRIVEDTTKLGSLGQVVYGLSVLTQLTGKRRYRDRAIELAECIPTERFSQDDDHSVLLGGAGALLGLLQLYEQSGKNAVLDRAVECGKQLAEARGPKWGYEVWDTNWNSDVDSCSTGMGHGAGGIAYALYRLFGHTDNREYQAVADQAVQFENVFYSEVEENWKANWTSPPYYSSSWCFGQSGIGLARLGSLKYASSPTLDRDLKRARSFSPTLEESDTLCHGTFSQVEFLIELGRQFPRFADDARNLATDALVRALDRGGYAVVLGSVDALYNPTFFLGTAGIGYTLLRILEPEKLPSVLRFE